jgi:hypothetical protein
LKWRASSQVQLNVLFSSSHFLEKSRAFGAQPLRKICAGNNINVHRLINLDMIGYPPANFAIIVGAMPGIR